MEAGILLPPVLPFKRIQISEKYPKGQSRNRHWKHLKQILQAENYQAYSPEEPNCASAICLKIMINLCVPILSSL